MNRSKLTPCRKVGLSRKKNTPLKTVEGILNKKENIVAEISNISDTQPLKKTQTPNIIAKSEVNNDTPCRPVGLSRKRKTSTPLGYFEINQNKYTPSASNNRISKNKTTNIKEHSHNSLIELCSTQSSDKTEIVKKDVDIPTKSNEQNHASCAKKLSNLFSSLSSAKKNGVKNSQDTQYSEENINTVSDSEKITFPKDILSKSVLENKIVNIKQKDHSCDNSTTFLSNGIAEQNNENPSQNNTKESKHTDKNVSMGLNGEVSTKNNEDLKIISRKNTQFIKVCYSTEKEYDKTQSKYLNPKKPKFTAETFDDDDFEIGPKQKKCFERSKTDVIKKKKKCNKNKLKKCLSVGDQGSRTLTDSSIISSSSSINLLNDCFVRLEQMKKSADQQSLRLTPQDHSDEDFETFVCTPKETKIKNLDSLEKEVEEKRQILDELKRAKIHKKMHSIEDLKELTARWKTGCIGALQDLLKQLNTHSQMTMEMLLKKLNIPEDFVPLSQ